jgi:hypothetical protein
MNANVGTPDRIIRLIIGAVLVALYLYGTVMGAWGVVLLVAGLVLILTALFKFCPLYRLLGANTCAR